MQLNLLKSIIIDEINPAVWLSDDDSSDDVLCEIYNCINIWILYSKRQVQHY